MIRYESDCVDCADGCHGCGLKRETPHLYCDECGEYVDKLYKFTDGRELCTDCLTEEFEEVKAEEDYLGNVQFMSSNHDYCKWCGQALDWRGEDD